MKEYLASKGADAEEDDDEEAWEAASTPGNQRTSHAFLLGGP